MKLTTKQLDKLIKEEFETTKQRINERAEPLKEKDPLADMRWSWIEKEFIPSEEFFKNQEAHERSPADEQLDDGDINRAQWRDAKKMEQNKIRQVAKARGGFFDDKMRNDPGNYLIKKGLEEPPEILQNIWSEILTGPDKDIANGIKLPMDYGASGLDGGLKRIMPAIKGKRWTRSKYGELKKSWMDILIDAWAQDGHLYGVFGGRAMRDMYQGKGYWGGQWKKASTSRKRRKQFWINFIAENGKMFKMALDQWTKQHASGMIGKAASWLGLEEQLSLSSKQLRDIIREELNEIKKVKE